MDNEKENEITAVEVQLNRAFDQVIDLLYRMRELKMAVTDPGAIRRGWGWNQDSEDLHRMETEVLYTIKGNATEFGGGVTTDQDRLLVRLQEAVKAE